MCLGPWRVCWVGEEVGGYNLGSVDGDGRGKRGALQKHVSTELLPKKLSRCFCVVFHSFVFLIQPTFVDYLTYARSWLSCVE